MDNIVKGYRHTGIICEDIEKSLYFYKDLLGLELFRISGMTAIILIK